GNPAVEVRGQIRIVAGPESATIAFEIGVAAKDPVAAQYAQRRRAVVKAGTVQISNDIAVDLERTPAQALSGIQNGARLTAAPAAPTAVNRRRRRVGLWRRVGRLCHFTHRRNRPVERASQVAILAGLQARALSTESRVGADFPDAVADNNRLGPIVEIGAIQVPHGPAYGQSPTLKTLPLEQGDLAGSQG